MFVSPQITSASPSSIIFADGRPLAPPANCYLLVPDTDIDEDANAF